MNAILYHDKERRFRAVRGRLAVVGCGCGGTKSLAWRLLDAAPMHPILFSFKRTYWSSMRFCREWAEEYEFTPARLDMVVAIARRHGGIAQVDLRATLGVCAPVVTRMLQGLEKGGYVQRRVHPDDRRQRWVTLTDYGRGLLGFVVTDLFFEGMIERFVRSLVAPGAKRRLTADRAVRRTRELLGRYRRLLEDVATLAYPAYLADGSRAPDRPFRPTLFGYFSRPRRRAPEPLPSLALTAPLPIT